MKPLFSVITPVYNGEDHIEETINSVLSQTFENFEYIIINDGSTDKSEIIIKKFKDKRLKLYTKINEGQSVAINYGWNLAQGTYLTYLSADDIFYKNYLTDSLEFIKLNPGYVLYYCDYNLIDKNSNFIKKFNSKEYDQKTMLQNLVCYPGIGPILLREIFLKTKGWNHNYKYLPDFEYWLRLSDFGKFKRIPKTLGGYRIHPKSNHVRDVSIDQANEMYNLIVNYLTDKKFNKSINTKLSLATAALLSGKIHLKSRRFILAIKFFFKSLKLYHLIFFKRVFWSSIISALRIQLYK